MSSHLRTVDLARAVGLSVQQVRNYEAWGFLPPAQRSANGYRLYTPRHLEALRTGRTLIQGYGWQQALGVMRALHEPDLDTALALVDARHADLDRARQRLEQTLAALTQLGSPAPTYTRLRGPRGLRVGEAARRVGVRVSAVRYWEQRGLLRPVRDDASHYRLYDEQHLRRLQVIVLLRQAGYDVDAISPVLDDLASNRVERALEAVELRRVEITRASRACAEATATLWKYAKPDSHPARDTCVESATEEQ